MRAEIYQTHPKHVLAENGLFEWERTVDVECRCGHRESKHLDGGGICLDKSKVDLTGTCICEIFALPNQTISTIPNTPKQKLPHKEQAEALLVKDGKITQDQGKFMRQYGII